MSPDEGLAFIYTTSDQPDLFLSYQPEGTTGLARRLNPAVPYVACRWPYTSENKAQWREVLLKEMALVEVTEGPSKGKFMKAIRLTGDHTRRRRDEPRTSAKGRWPTSASRLTTRSA